MTSQQVTKAPKPQQDHSDLSVATRMRGLAGNHTLQRKCACGDQGDKCEQCPKPENKTPQRAAQMKVAANESEQQVSQVPAENHTGLPTPLKSGLEALSGMDLSGVQVHRNSSKPDQINALAYTEGQEIHMAPGQEAHLPHEGWHVVQQMQGRVRPTIQAKGKSINDDAHLEREADVMGARALSKNSIQDGNNASHAVTSAAYSPHSTIQRQMKFEFQTTNRIWRNDGVNPPELLGRKYGPDDFIVNDTVNEVRLESETDGVIEFETEWFRKWSALEKAIKAAVKMTDDMNKAPDVGGGRKAFPFNVEHLRKGTPAEMKKGVLERKTGMEGDDKILKKGEQLEVEILNKSWPAAIQSSEAIALTQFESLLTEHEPTRLSHTVSHADKILTNVATSAGKAPADLQNLRSFLQIIFYYIERGQRVDLRKKEEGGPLVPPQPAKFAFLLMNRTSFSSIYKSLLTPEEQEFFNKIVKDKLILKELIEKDTELALKESSKFFKYGHGGGVAGPTIDAWLKSIIDPGKFGQKVTTKKGKKVLRDLLSPPVAGSVAMGAFDVEKKGTGLVRFEVRSTTTAHMGGRVQPADKWVDYAEEIFTLAAEKRKRPEKSLIYDPKPPSFELVPRFTLTLGEEKAGAEFEFRKFLPSLLDGKLKPFIYTGIGTGGITGGAGASFDPFQSISLFVTGKIGARTEWFTSIEVGGGLEAGWAFGKNRSLRLGVGWEEWQDLGEEGQRTHLLNVFFGIRR